MLDCGCLVEVSLSRTFFPNFRILESGGGNLGEGIELPHIDAAQWPDSAVACGLPKSYTSPIRNSRDGQ